METWDNVQPDREGPRSGSSETPAAGLGDGLGNERGDDERRADSLEDDKLREDGDGRAQLSVPELHRALHGIADELASPVREDLYPQVMARAGRIRRRRRAVRASSATAVLAAVALLGPSIAAEVGARGGDAAAAPPPSAVVDLTSAYPVPEAVAGNVAVATPARPENALSWPSRGATVPSQAVDIAKTYLLDQAGKAGGRQAAEGTTATVDPLWAQVEEQTAAKTSSQSPHTTWLYVMQGWTTGANGAPSQAELLVGTYTQTSKSSSMAVFATPVIYAHVRPGSSNDSDDAVQIAELSVWLPGSNRLVVLGAPQTKTVLYARTGGDLVPQKTVDGVAVFQRTHRMVKGRYDDTIQVRDAKNVALTPPKAWSAADFPVIGSGRLWSSATGEWVAITGRWELGPGSLGASGSTTAAPGTAPVTGSARPGGTPSATTNRSSAVGAAPGTASPSASTALPSAASSPSGTDVTTQISGSDPLASPS